MQVGLRTVRRLFFTDIQQWRVSETQNFKELSHQNPKQQGVNESKLTGQFMAFSLPVQPWNDFSMTM